jgi:hypothetical protein
LFDKLNGTAINLREADYEFNAVGQIKDRFVLHFRDPGQKISESLVPDNRNTDTENIRIITEGNRISVYNIDQDALVEFFDISGRLICVKHLAGEHRFMTELKPGYYIMRISNSSINLSEKIVIR